MLANIYLHYVFDLWVDAWRRKCAQGEVAFAAFLRALFRQDWVVYA